ncbi:MAG: universal stress protein [Longimicrobiales bacterium]
MTDHDLRSILVGTDLTPGSDPILAAAGALAQHTGAALHVVHALDFEARPGAPAIDDAPFTTVVERAEAALDAQLAAAGLADAVSREVMVYIAHKAIAARAEDVRADLIVIGPHSRRSTAQGILGTTADQVIRCVPMPVLIVRGTLELPPRRIVFATDGSPRASTALLRVRELARALDTAELRLLHVSSDPVAAGTRETIEHDALSAGADALPVSFITGQPVADAIVAYAERERVDLLALGTRGHGAVRRAVIGSVASRVVRRATCSVVLAPGLDHGAP